MTISTISKADFLFKLTEAGLNVENEGFQLNESLVIDSKIVNWRYREIRNVEFSELVRVSKVEIQSGLAFKNCKFHKDITIRGLDSIEFDTALNPFNTSVLLEF